ncbi:hypothetical protein, partial [Paraburkholderia sp. RL17-347-BIC-D]|uniref:hypothetical protein n=1 Tax=Paraburkholderia sp. RL17-347-BIC-D TaxID=3031632 RepID=UPI0038B77EFF
MSIPTVVFLDTSVLTGQQFNFASTALTTFLPAAQKAGLKLLLPDPTCPQSCDVCTGSNWSIWAGRHPSLCGR